MPRIRLSRAEQQAQTRQGLLNAAETVFSRLGYGGASVDLIALEAGYSKGAVYSNFSSKQELFLELLRVNMERDFAELEDIVQMDDVEQLIEEDSRWLKSMHSRADYPAINIELQLHARRNPEFAGDFYSMQDQKIRQLAHILSKFFEARGGGTPLDPIDMAYIFDALAHGLALQRPVRKAGELNEAGRIISDLLGVLAPKKDSGSEGQSKPAPRRKKRLAPPSK